MGYWRVNPTIEGREHGIVVSTTRGFQTAMNSNSNEPGGKTTCHIPTAKAGWNIARASSPSLFHRWHDYSSYALHPKTSRLTNGFSPFVQPSCNANTWCSKSHEPKNRMVGKMDDDFCWQSNYWQLLFIPPCWKIIFPKSWIAHKSPHLPHVGVSINGRSPESPDTLWLCQNSYGKWP